MAYKTSKSKKNNKNKLVASVTLLLVILILGGGTFAFMSLQKNRVRVNAETFCPVDGPAAITAVLVDSSDPFSAVQQEYLRKFFNEFLEKSVKGQLIEVYSASDFGQQSFAPSVSLCNPGNGQDVSEWTSNPDRIRARWEQAFDKPLRETITGSLNSGVQQSSPLLEIIQYLSIHSFPLSEKNNTSRLILVSDMLEHTREFSQYRSRSDFSSVADQPFFAHLTPNLQGVQVDVIYISRPGKESLQTRSHANFWGEYFTHFGAFLSSFKKI